MEGEPTLTGPPHEVSPAVWPGKGAAEEVTGVPYQKTLTLPVVRGSSLSALAALGVPRDLMRVIRQEREGNREDIS